MLYAGHANLLGALDSSLNTQVGLAVILQPEAAVAPQTRPDPPTAAAAIAAADPALRVALRRNGAIMAVILSDLTVRALVIANEFSAGGDPARGHDYISALAREVARDLDHVCDLGLTLTLNPSTPTGLAIDREVARSQARSLARALVLAIDRGPLIDREVDQDLAREVARILVRTFDLVTPGRALDLDRALAPQGTCAPALGRALVIARDLARQTALDFGHALGIQQVEGLAAALLQGALDDFTCADLAHADLTDCDLTGVRWSDRGTRWPTGTDIGGLRARSREVAPGAGIYVIANPCTSNKALHRAPN